MTRLPAALLAALLSVVCLTPAWAQPARGKKYALLVGVKEYDHAGLAPLSYTENDSARRWRSCSRARPETTWC